MSQDVIVNGTTYPAVEAVVMQDANGNPVTYYPDAVRYAHQTLTPEQQAQARENIGIDEAFKAEITALVIESLGGDPVFGYVDPDTMTIVLKNAPDGEYSLAYLKEDGTISAPIGSMVKDTNVYYTVANTLTNCTNSNSSTKVTQGGAYSATITAKSGYELSSVKVTMGGADIASTAVSGGAITIAKVTGDIVITATATEIQTGPTYTNLATKIAVDQRYSASNGSGLTLISAPGYCTHEDFIPFVPGTTVRVKGMGDLTKQNSMFYQANKTLNTSGKVNAMTTHTGYSYDSANDIVTLTPKNENNAYARFTGVLSGTAADVVITVDEPIV